VGMKRVDESDEAVTSMFASSRVRPPGACYWRRHGGRYAIVGPASVVKVGAIVDVWNQKMRTFTKVLIGSTLGEGGDGKTVGFKSNAALLLESWDDGSEAETLEEWRARKSASDSPR